MSKRKFEEIDDGELDNLDIGTSHSKKHTLDSDEEDSGDDERYNIMHENDIEGEEEGISGTDGEIKFTPFNMKEELEEGHFDRDGHFQWDKDKEIRDNWLDNIDWVKIKGGDKQYSEKKEKQTLGESSDDESENENDSSKQFNEYETYKEILKMMEPKETVKKALRRLGGKTLKLSSVERWRQKKAGVIDENSKLVTRLTELADKILTNLGNMNVYEETYEMIQSKLNKNLQHKSDKDLDMFSDDFDNKQETKIGECSKNIENEEDTPQILLWEYKWKQEDNEIHGPFTTEQMQHWVDEGYFKNGVFVRKVGEGTNFYTSNRIDFELYM